MFNTPIYLDHNATTPVDPLVLEEMLPYFTEKFGNAASKHEHGNYGLNAVEFAREAVRDFFHGNGQVIFTSGATEANNIFLQGACDQNTHLITSAVEHKCVLNTALHLRSKCEVSIVPVDEFGMVQLEEVKKLVNFSTKKKIVVSVMATNNEVGTKQPLAELVETFKGKENVIFHSDMAQAIGKYPIYGNMMPQAASISAHKFYGPKGVGALWMSSYILGEVRNRIMFGGGQEYGLRPGTSNVPGIVGLSAALRSVSDKLASEDLVILRQKMLDRFMRLEGVKLNGHPTERQPGNLNVSFECVDAQELVRRVSPKVSISTGSACTSTSQAPSHVLKAMRLSDDDIASSIRICLGQNTTEAEVDVACWTIIEEVESLRSESSLWNIKKRLVG
jgi:cysteine desulfurase